MKTNISTQIQLILGLILLLLYILFPPQGYGVLFIVPVLGLLGMRFLDNLLAKNRQLSYNWLTLRRGRTARPAASLPVSRTPTQVAASQVQERIETNISLALIAWVPATLGFYFALENLAQRFYAGLDNAYIVPVGTIYWGVLAIIAGASVALAVSQFGMALTLGKHYPEYAHQVERYFGFNLGRAVAWLVPAGFTAVALLIGPGLVTYTRFSSSGIAVHSPFELQERTRSFDEIRHIKLVTVPSQTRRGTPTAYFDIGFSDGTEWTSPRFDSDTVPPLYWDAVNYSAQHSQRAIERVAYAEAFTTGARSWPISIIDSDEALAIRSISRGEYTWQVESKDDMVLWQAARMPAVSDFQLDLDCQRLEGSAAALCGAILRRNAGDYYMFLIGEDQTIRFYLHYHDWVPLFEMHSVTAVLPNQNNHITANAVGSHFTFWVNGQLVAEADDSTLHNGTAGVVLQLPANHEATIQFSNLEVLEK